MLIDGIDIVEGSAIKNLVVASDSVFPQEPDKGELFFHTTDGFLYFYNGTAWSALASLSSGKLLASQLPALAITDVFPVSSQAEMLALNAQRGDIAIRSDLNKTFALSADTPSVLGAWVELLSPTSFGPANVTGVPYDIATSVYGKPANSEVSLRFRAARSFVLSNVQTNGQAKAATTATAATTFTITRNGTTIGTIVFAAGSANGTITVSAATTFAVGDIISILAPATADSTLADIDFTLVAALA